jgi:antitoxin VapB
MKTSKAKVSRRGKTLTVSVSGDFTFDGDEAYVAQVGDKIVIFPRKDGWESLFSSLESFSEDFMSVRPAEIPQDRLYE